MQGLWRVIAAAAAQQQQHQQQQQQQQPGILCLQRVDDVVGVDVRVAALLVLRAGRDVSIRGGACSKGCDSAKEQARA